MKMCELLNTSTLSTENLNKISPVVFEIWSGKLKIRRVRLFSSRCVYLANYGTENCQTTTLHPACHKSMGLLIYRWTRNQVRHNNHSLQYTNLFSWQHALPPWITWYILYSTTQFIHILEHISTINMYMMYHIIPWECPLPHEHHPPLLISCRKLSLQVMQTVPGVRNVHVTARLHPTEIGWNLVLAQKIPTCCSYSLFTLRKARSR